MAPRVAGVRGLCTSTGIGEACALRLVDGGWHVFARVRRDEDGRRLVTAATGTLEPVRLDVTDEASVEEVHSKP